MPPVNPPADPPDNPSPANVGTRRYHSPVREQSALRTRTAIVDAARTLLVENGYQATSITDIARHAHVARPTVVATFGSKAALLAAVVDEALAGDDEPLPVADREWFRPVWDARTPRACVTAYAHVCTVIGQRTGAVFEAVRRAVGAGGEVADLWATLQSNRRAGAVMVVDRIVSLGRLHPALSRDQAVDVLWLLNDPGLHVTLVDDCGWTEPAFDEWLAVQMRRDLLP